MADEVAELKVRITGDAASLESTISGVEKQLKGLEQAGKLSESTRKALDKVTTGTLRYRDVVNNAKTVLDEKNAALAKAEKAYASNEKKIKSNISSLTQERDAVQSLVLTKQDEIKSLEQVGKSYGKNSQAYKENQKAIQWTQTELSALTQQYRDCDRQISAQEALLTKESNKRDLAVKSAENAEKTYNRLSSSLEQVEKAESALQLQKTGAQWKEAGEAIDTFTKPFQHAAVGLAAGGVAAAKFAIDFEDSFAAVEKTVDGTPEQLEKVRQGIIDLTTVGIDGRSAIPMTTAQLNELAAAGGQLGIETDNIIEFTETMAQLGTATNLVGEEGAKTLARYMNVTQTSQDQVRNLGSAIVYLGNNYATTEAEIAEMAMRLGRTGTLVNMNAADVLGYSTALSSLGINAEAGGSAVSRTWTRLDNAAATGGEALELFAEVSGQTAEEFRQSWETDASEAFNSFIKGLEQAENLPLLLQALDINDIRESDALKALSLGYETMTKAVSDANAAWSENVALQKEFDTRAATTASQIQLMKNNLVEAARSIGETFLPDIVNATDWIKSFAQNIARMSDAEKENLINTGKWIIGIGAASKVVSSGVKGVGSLLDAFGKMKGAFAAGGALAKFAPALTGIASAAGPVALAVAGIGVAAFAAKKGYDAWYDSQYRWTKGLSDGNDEIRKSMEEMRELSGIQQEIRDQKLIIENPQSSQEQVETAKARIEEIKELLSEEHNLVIKSDNSNLEETVEQLQTINENEIRIGISRQTQKMQSLRPSYERYKIDAAQLEQEEQALLETQAAYSDLNLEIGGLLTEYDNLNSSLQSGTISQDKYNKRISGWKNEVEGVSNSLKELNPEMDYALTAGADTEYLASGLSMMALDVNRAFTVASENLEKFTTDFNNLTGSYKENIAVATEISNWNTELLGKAALEGDAEEVERLLKSMGLYMQMVDELDASGYAQKAALAMNGLDSLETAWQQGGAALEGVVQDYIRASEAFGVSAEKTAAGAALIKNEFRTAQEAADAGALEEVTEQANELAKTMEDFPDGGTITISAEGDVSLIGYAQEQVNSLLSNGDISIGVNSEGDTALLDKAQNEVTELEGIGQVHIGVQADGSINVLDEANQLVANIPPNVDSNVDVTYTKGEQEEPEDQNATVNYEKGWQNSPSDENAKVNYELGTQANPENKTAYVYYEAASGDFARGTQDFSGGLARINDQRGIPDPRELVEVNGQQYLFEGRDVILPLPEHAKVYTASQTKQIMSMRGIRSYASGKNNEAWDAAQENWRHYTKVNNVSAEEELAHWQEMLKQFADDAEVVKEIQEEIVDSTKKMWDESLATMEFNLEMGWISEEEYYSQLAAFRDENFAPNTEEWREATLELHKYSQDLIQDANDVSDAWLELRGALNDWDEIGDSMGAAYNRIKERNLEAVQSGDITGEEYYDFMNDTSDRIIDNYLNYSDSWMEHEQNYNAMSPDETIAAIDRQQAEVDQFFADIGTLTDEQYVAKLEIDTELAEKRMDAFASKMDSWRDDADWYQQQAEVYGWDFMNPGDTEIDYWKRRLNKEIAASQDMALSQNERYKALRQADLARMEIYQLQQESVDEFFSAASEAIDAAREKFNKEEEALRESWEVEDRAANKEEIQAQLDQYKYAVTKEGKDRYAELQEQMKEIEREEELYALQKKNNAVIEQMEADLAAAESEKKKILEQVQAGTVNIQSLMERINDTKNENSVAGVLQNILDKMDDVSVVKNNNINQNNYNYVSDLTTAIAFGNAAGRAFQYDSYGG